jgi:hypothetical protein
MEYPRPEDWRNKNENGRNEYIFRPRDSGSKASNLSYRIDVGAYHLLSMVSVQGKSAHISR